LPGHAGDARARPPPAPAGWWRWLWRAGPPVLGSCRVLPGIARPRLLVQTARGAGHPWWRVPGSGLVGAGCGPIAAFGFLPGHAGDGAPRYWCKARRMRRVLMGGLGGRWPGRVLGSCRGLQGIARPACWCGPPSMVGLGWPGRRPGRPLAIGANRQRSRQPLTWGAPGGATPVLVTCGDMRGIVRSRLGVGVSWGGRRPGAGFW